MDRDTIAALSTPMGRGGIAVIRISGDKTLPILKKVVNKLPDPISARKVYHAFVVSDGKKVDECMVVFFKKPRSYTGEDLAEISIHSNPFVIEEPIGEVLSPMVGCPNEVSAMFCQPRCKSQVVAQASKTKESLCMAVQPSLPTAGA